MDRICFFSLPVLAKNYFNSKTDPGVGVPVKLVLERKLGYDFEKQPVSFVSFSVAQRQSRAVDMTIRFRLEYSEPLILKTAALIQPLCHDGTDTGAESLLLVLVGSPPAVDCLPQENSIFEDVVIVEPRAKVPTIICKPANGLYEPKLRAFPKRMQIPYSRPRK